MADSFDAVQELWEKAKPEDKNKYLFKALACLRKEMISKFDQFSERCDNRPEDCNKIYLSKRYARLLTIIILALTLGIAIGGGYITFNEIIKLAPKTLL